MNTNMNKQTIAVLIILIALIFYGLHYAYWQDKVNTIKNYELNLINTVINKQQTSPDKTATFEMNSGDKSYMLKCIFIQTN